MSNFKLIEKLGLYVINVFIDGEAQASGRAPVVRASDLEKLLSDATKVKGYKEDGDWVFGELDLQEYDTHTALLIAIEPIERGVTKAEIKDAIRCCVNDSAWEDRSNSLRILWDRIETHGLKKD